mgnify:CR=1 FL=1
MYNQKVKTDIGKAGFYACFFYAIVIFTNKQNTYDSVTNQEVLRWLKQ